MINIVWRTDVHMSDKSPSSRTDDWNETILGKLGQVRDVARQKNATLILDGGDFFHIKSPNRNSHETIRKVADHHSTYPCPVYCTPGNHDSVYGDYEFLGQQPLGVLFATGVFKRLYDEFEVFLGPADATSHMSKVYPYNKNNGGFTSGTPFGKKAAEREMPVVRIVGVPFHGNTYDMTRFTSIEKGEEDILICVAHVLASQKGGSMFEGEDIVKYADLVDTAPDVFLFGHWHKDQGVVELGGKTFVNIGSLTRGSLSQDEVQRRPACAILSCSKSEVEVEVHRLDVRPAGEVFDVERRAQQVKRQTDMDSFVASIQETLEASEEEGATVQEVIAGWEDVASDVRERALHYMEQAG